MANAPLPPRAFLPGRIIYFPYTRCNTSQNPGVAKPFVTQYLSKMQMQTPANDYRTPADAVNHRQELRPLPLRVAQKQYERLDAARARTGLSIQEHARRAMDLYLAVIEREAIELGLMPERFSNSPREVPAPAEQGLAPLEPTGAAVRKARTRVAKR